MTRYTFSYKSLLIGFSLLGLLALGAGLFVQAPLSIGAVVYEDKSDTISATIVDPLTNAHPADRKFFTHNYAMSGTATTNTYLLAEAHPADRKFFTGAYEIASKNAAEARAQSEAESADRKFFTGAYETASTNAAEARAQSEAETADRKLQDLVYMEILMEQVRLGLVESIHPADRKFFTNSYFWSASVGETAVDGD